jgi:hypothetical protein
VALGREDRHGRFDDVMLLVGDQLVEGSTYRLLAEHGGVLFGDEYFADLFKRSGTSTSRICSSVRRWDARPDLGHVRRVY